MSLTRRTLLTSAGLLAGAPLLSKTALAVNAPLATTQLSPAVLAATSKVIGETTAKIHLRTAVRGDLERAADAIELLRQHLRETPFHETIQAMAQKASITEFDNAGIQRRVFNEVWKYDHAISIDEIQIPVDLSAGVLELRAHGLDRGLKQIAQGMRGAAVRLPVGYWGGGWLWNGPVLLRAQVGGSGPTFCDTAGFYLNLFGGAIGVVAMFGCTPEPAFVLVCPILGLLAGILGIVSFAQWIWC